MADQGIFETIKLLFTSDAMAACVTILFAAIYITIILPDRKELQNYRELLHNKLYNFPVGGDLTVLIQTAVQVELTAQTMNLKDLLNDRITDIVEQITTEIIKYLNINREYYAQIAAEKVIDIKTEIGLLNTLLNEFNNYLQEMDMRNETLLTELSEITTRVNSIIYITDSLITQLEEKKMIDPINRESSNVINSQVIADATNQLVEKLDSMKNVFLAAAARGAGNKVNRVLNPPPKKNYSSKINDTMSN